MSSLTDTFYKEMLEHCQSYNSRLMAERKARLPYLDSQTKVAQNGCSLWFEKRHRGPGLGPNQVYSYPSKRWKKRPRFNSISESTFDSIYVSEVAHLMNENSNDASSVNTFSNPAVEHDQDTHDSSSLGASALVDEDDYYDDDDFEMPSRKKGRKGQKPVKPPRKSDPIDDKDKLYACEYCGKKYKNKPGLNYHLQHVHQDEIDADDEYTPNGRHTPSSIMSDDHHSTSSRTSALAAQKAVAAAVADIGEEEEGMETRNKRKQEPQSSKYCDFCLGGADENRKTGQPEELVSCADCGRSGHPSCLQFTDIMTMNVKKYKWQCIECKSCHLCGTSDNDDQLLFCDDCDRGYHMYCLDPPMEEPPEGSWICDLCENDRKEREKNNHNEEQNTQTISL